MVIFGVKKSIMKKLLRLYQSSKPNFILIDVGEKHGKEVNRELCIKKELCVTVHFLLTKITNFNRVWASVVCNHLAKTTSKSVHPFCRKFVYKHSDRHTDTQTSCNKNITPPRFCGGVKKRLHVTFLANVFSYYFQCCPIWFKTKLF